MRCACFRAPAGPIRPKPGAVILSPSADSFSTAEGPAPEVSKPASFEEADSHGRNETWVLC